MKLLQNPLVRLAMVIAIVAALWYMPTREFLKLTFMMGIPFVMLLGIAVRQYRFTAKWWMSAILLLAVVGAYGYLLTGLPERIEIRRIVSEGGALVAEGRYEQAMAEYCKLGDLGKTEKMKEKIAEAEVEQKAAQDLQKGKDFMNQGKTSEAKEIFSAIPDHTRAGHEAHKLLQEIK